MTTIGGNAEVALWLVMEQAAKQLGEVAHDAHKTTLALGDAQGAATMQRAELVYEAHIKQHHANFTDARIQMAGAVLGAMGGSNGGGGASGGAGSGGGTSANGGQGTTSSPTQVLSFLQNNLGLVGQLWKIASGDFKRDTSVKGLITSMSQSALQSLSDVQSKLAQEDREEAEQLERAANIAGEAAALARRVGERARQEQEEVRDAIIRAKDSLA